MSYLVDNNISIAFVQETWIRKSDSHLLREIQEFGYDILMYRKPRRLDLGGGVAIIFNKSLKLYSIKTNNYRSFECITCKVLSDGESYLFSNIYRPDYSMKNRYTVKKFLGEFRCYLDELEHYALPHVVLGDFNLHVETLSHSYPHSSLSTSYEIKKRTEALAFNELLQTYGLKQRVDKPTHEHGGTLDLLILNKDVTNFDSYEVINKNYVCESDHNPLYFTMTINALYSDEKYSYQFRDFSSLDKNKFIDDVFTCNLLPLTNDMNVHDTVTTVNSVLLSVLNDHCPMQSKTVRKRANESRRWYNDDLRTLKKKKRAKERAWNNCKCEFHETAYDDATKLYKKALYSSRTKGIIKSIDDSRHDAKTLYKTIKNIMGDNEVSSYPSSSSTKQLADDMAKYYADKIVKVREEIGCADAQLKLEADFSHGNSSAKAKFENFLPLTETETRNLIKDMTNKHHHEDPIPAWLLKENEDLLFPVIQSIINKSFSEGTFPVSLKHGTIKPIIKDKNGDRENFKNYRPVTNIPFMAKLIEKAANNQIVNYLEQNDMFPSHQSAYRKRHSCETAMLKIVDDIKVALSEKKMVMLVLLDLSSAFDTIDQDILLFKLQRHFGICGNVLKWIESYLKGRTFCVRIKNINGKLYMLVYGVPQGTILGPLLFVLYIHDLVLIGEKHNILVELYADDSQWYFSFSPLTERSAAMQNIQICMAEIKEWMSKNCLKVNFDKTDAIFLSNPQNHSLFFNNISCTIQGKHFTNLPKQTVKSLGIVLDSSVSMTNMALECVKTCYFKLSKLNRIRRYLPEDIKLTLLTSYVLSRLDYCNALYATCPKAIENKLQRLLNACVRFVVNVPNGSGIKSFSKDLHILPVKFRIMFKLCLLVYKIMYSASPVYLDGMIIQKLPRSISFLRSSLDLTQIELPNNQSTYQFLMAKYWNMLPIHIRCSNTIENFKTQLKTYYFSCAFS